MCDAGHCIDSIQIGITPYVPCFTLRFSCRRSNAIQKMAGHYLRIYFIQVHASPSKNTSCSCQSFCSPPPTTPQPINFIYNFVFDKVIASPLWIHATASLTSSSTTALALFFSFTTAAALPIKKGRALSIVSSSISSLAIVSKSAY